MNNSYRYQRNDENWHGCESGKKAKHHQRRTEDFGKYRKSNGNSPSQVERVLYHSSFVWVIEDLRQAVHRKQEKTCRDTQKQ